MRWRQGIPVLLVSLAVVAAGCGRATSADAGSSTTASGAPATSTTAAEGSPESEPPVTAPTAPPAIPVPDPACAPPITPPPFPETIPETAELDPETGLHVTGTPVAIDLAAYRLEVTGLVDYPVSLTYDELRCLPKVEAAPLLDCPGFFVDEASWAGVRLADLLALAGARAEASRVRLVAADGYSVSVELTPDTLASAFLAYELEGTTLPVLHGFPLRLVWPDHSGFDWIKWVVAVEVS